MKKFSDPRQESAVLGYLSFLGFTGIEPSAICPVEDFTDERWRPIYAAAVSLHRAGWSVNHFSLAEEISRLELDTMLERHFPLGWQEWTSHVDTSLQFAGPAAVTQCLRAIREYALARKASGIGKALLDGDLTVGAASVQLREIRDESESESLDAMLDARRFDAAKPPPPSRTIYGMRGKVICTPGNLSAILAKMKAGKSGGVGGMLAASFGLEGDTLGFESENPEGKAVLHFDTEQSPRDHHDLVVIALKRVRLTDCPPWLRSYRFTDVPRDWRFELVERELRRAAKVHGGIHSAIIDGIADFIRDPNDAAEAFAAIERLHQLAIEYDTAILCVLHINPASEVNKSRGHLGSQLERKAESNLTIEKDESGISTIYSTASRHLFLPKPDGPRFRWDAEAGMHLSCGSEREEKEIENVEKLRGIAEAAFGSDALRYVAARDAIRKVARVKDSRAEGLFTDMKKAGILGKDDVGFWKVLA